MASHRGFLYILVQFLQAYALEIYHCQTSLNASEVFRYAQLTVFDKVLVHQSVLFEEFIQSAQRRFFLAFPLACLLDAPNLYLPLIRDR
jgi:hypothetical protein